MVTINKAYIKVNSEKEKHIIEELLKETFVNVEIKWKGNIAKFVVFEKDSFQLQLIKLVSLNLQDLGVFTSVLIVPFFNDVFIKYLDKINNSVVSAFEVFVSCIKEPQVFKDAKYIYDSIEKKDLDTIKAFLCCNANSCVAANELYLHRNSFNYRMNHFINKTQIDIRDLNSLMFINLIINICA